MKDHFSIKKKDKPILVSDTKNSNGNFNFNLPVSLSNYISTIQLKIILLGDIFVGKTSIIKTIKFGSFPITYNATLAIDFTSLTFKVNDKEIAEALIWDTCGSEKFRSITRSYYNDVNGVLLVFDYTNRKSFTNLIYWLDDLNNNITKLNDELIAPILLIGNKCDIPSEDREVTSDEAYAFAEEKGLNFMETSAKEGINIKEAFEELVDLIMIKIEDKTLHLEYSKLSDKPSSLTHLDVTIKSDKKVKNAEAKSKCC